MHAQLRMKNVGPRPLELSLRGRTIAFGVIVETLAGAMVWRRLEGAVIPAILRLEVIPPGGELRLEATWDQRTNPGAPVPHGRYLVRAELPTDATPLRPPPASIEITPHPLP